MDGDQRKIVIVAGICIMLIIGMFAVCTKPALKKNETNKANTTKKSVQIKSKKSSKSKETNPSYSTGEGLNLSSGGSGGYASTISTSTENKKKEKEKKYFNSSRSVDDFERKAIISKKSLEKNQKYLKAAELKQAEFRKKELEKVLNDPNAHPKLKLKAQLINSKDYRIAFFAYEQKDYKTAIKHYYAVLNSKDSTPEMKYIALEGLEDCSKYIHDLELFCLAAKEKGKLLAKKDLSVLNKKIDKTYYEWAVEFSTYMHARKDSAIMSKLIQTIMEKSEIEMDEARTIVENKIRKYENMYKEFAS